MQLAASWWNTTKVWRQGVRVPSAAHYTSRNLPPSPTHNLRMVRLVVARDPWHAMPDVTERLFLGGGGKETQPLPSNLRQ